MLVFVWLVPTGMEDESDKELFIRQNVFRDISLDYEQPAATRGINIGVPDKLIMERTGHRSVAALHSYQHPSEKSKEMVSDIIAGTSKTLVSVVDRENQKEMMSCKRKENEDSDNGDKAKSARQMGVFNFSNWNVVFK